MSDIQSGAWTAREDLTHLGADELIEQIIDRFVSLAVVNGTSVEGEVHGCFRGLMAAAALAPVFGEKESVDD